MLTPLIRLLPVPLRKWWPVLVAVIALVLIFTQPDNNTAPDNAAPNAAGWRITCTDPVISDGDTFRCGAHRIRLAGIDAPEMPGHCRPGRACTPGDPFAAQAFLRALARGVVTCRRTDTDHYGRIVARCEAGGQDLSCAMINAGHAVRRYGSISCPS